MNFRKAMYFASSIVLAVFAVAPSIAMADAGGSTDSSGMRAIGAALAIGLAAFGGALGQGKTAAAALEGIARNPAVQDKIFTPMIICLALIESLVLYAFVIAFLVK
jgi:F-type H+-transporting ATPase subunit c